jgi:hypothetical protein
MHATPLAKQIANHLAATSTVVDPLTFSAAD